MASDSDRPTEWAVRLWNQFVPVGAEVELLNDLGELEQTQTRSEAWALCNQPVVKVEGLTGGYLLHRLRPLPRPGKQAAAALVREAVQLHHQQCFNVLNMLVDTMRATYARRSPNITPTLELRHELLEQLADLVRDVDPHNSKRRMDILDSLTAAPKVYLPFDPSVPFPPSDVEELREALEAGQRAGRGLTPEDSSLVELFAARRYTEPERRIWESGWPDDDLTPVEVPRNPKKGRK